MYRKTKGHTRKYWSNPEIKITVVGKFTPSPNRGKHALGAWENNHSHSQNSSLKEFLNALENSNGGAKVVPIILLRHYAFPVQGDHVGAGLGAQAPNIDVRGALNSDNVVLAGFGREACLPIVVEEGVESALQTR